MTIKAGHCGGYLQSDGFFSNEVATLGASYGALKGYGFLELIGTLDSSDT
jgi:hypothetical protein